MKKKIKSFISAILILCMLMTMIPSPAFAQNSNEPVLLPASQMNELSENEEANGVIYMGTAGERVSENGNYLLTVYRGGNSEDEASVSLNTIDVSATIKEDYDILEDGAEYYDLGGTVMERNAYYDSRESVDNYIESVNEIKDELKDSSEKSDGEAPESELAKIKEEQTGEETRAIASDGELLTDSDFLTEMFESYGGAEITPEEYQENAAELNKDMKDNLADYIAVSSTTLITFAPGETEKQIEIEILSDREAEGDEMFTLLLSTPAGAELGDLKTTNLTIEDDEEVETAYLGFESDTLKVKDGKVKIIRTGADYSLVSADMILENGESMTVYIKPYETEAEVELDITGSGEQIITLDNFKGCEAGDITSCKVLFGENAKGMTLREIRNASGLPELEVQNDGIAQAAGVYNDATSLELSNVTDNLSANNPAYKLRVDYVPGQYDEYAHLYGKIMDPSYNPEVYVGNYYFPDGFVTGLFKGDIKYHQYSDWHKDGASDSPDGFINLEYYDWRTWMNGKSYTRLDNINHEIYGYYAVDWNNKPYWDFSPKSANGLIKILTKDSYITQKLYKHAYFDRTRTSLTALDGNMPQRTYGKICVYASDENDSATPDPIIHLYGIAAMFRKFDVNLESSGTMKFKNGNGVVDKVPCNPKLGVGHELRYYDQTLAIEGTSATDDATMPGELIGYKITTNHLNEEGKSSVFYYMANGRKPWEAENIDIADSSVPSSDIHYGPDMTNIHFDTDFVSIVDKHLKGITGSGINWKTDLSFKPLYDYKDVVVQINSSEDGTLEGYAPGVYTDVYHAGDVLSLLGIPADQSKVFAGVKIEARATYNVNEEKLIDETKWSDNQSALSLTLGQKGCRYYVLTPVFKEKQGNYISFAAGENSENLSVMNVLSPEQIDTINAAYPDYQLDRNQLIYICDPSAEGATEAEKLVNMITAVPGKIYRIQAVGKENSDGTYWAPVYENEYTYGNVPVSGYTAYVAASNELDENIVNISAVSAKHSDDVYIELHGIIKSREYSIRESSENMGVMPMQGLTVYGSGMASNMWVTLRDSNETIKTTYPELPQTTTDESGFFSLPGIVVPNIDAAYAIYYTNGDIEGIRGIRPQDVDKFNSNIIFYKNATGDDPGREDYQTNYQVRITKSGYSEGLKEDVITPVFTEGAPYPTNVNYRFDSGSNTVKYGTAGNSVPILDDFLTVSTDVNLNGRHIRQVIFTLDKVKSADIDYTIDAKVGQTSFECDFGGKNMQDVFEPGDKIYITLVDEEKRAVKYQLFYEDGDTVRSEYQTEYEDIKYTKVYSGLSFYVPMVDEVPQTFTMPDSGNKLDLPVVGDVMGSATSGVISFNKNKWDESLGIDGYSLVFDINASILGTPSKPATDVFNDVKKMKNDAAEVAKDPKNIRNYVENYGWWENYKTKDEIKDKTFQEAYKKSLTDTFGKNKINLNVTVLMNFDFAYSDTQGAYVLVGSQLAFGGTFKISHTFYTVISSVPLFVKLTASVTAQIQANVPEVSDMTADKFSEYENLYDAMPPLDCGLFLLLTGRIDAGVGICGVLSARGILELDITIFMSFVDINNKSGIMATLKGGVGIDLLIFSFEYIAEIGTLGAGIYEDETGWGDGTNVASIALMLGDGSIRTYNTGGGGKVGEYSDSAQAANAVGYTTLLKNAPERTRPQIVTLSDGRKLMVYIGSDSSRELDANKNCLYYSVYENGVWSEAQPIENDGTADSIPQLAVYGNNVLIVWSDATRAFTETDDEKTMISLFDISATLFNGDENSLSQPLNLSADEVRYENMFMDYNPVICADPDSEDGSVAVYYIKKDLGTAVSDEDLVNPNKTYQTIVMTLWLGENAGEERFIALEGDPFIMNFDAVMTEIPVNGEKHMFTVCTYVLDKDNDLSTSEDDDVYLMFYDVTADKSYAPINLCNDYLADSAPQIEKLWNKDTEEIILTWMTQTSGDDSDSLKPELRTLNISSLIDLAKENGENAAEMIAEPSFRMPVSSVSLSENKNKDISLTEYKFLKGGDGNTYLLWTDNGSMDEKDYSIELYAAVEYAPSFSGIEGEIERETDGWSKPVRITDFSDYVPNTVIDEFAATVGNDGEFALVSNMYTQNIDENGRPVYSENDLVEFTIDTSKKIAVEQDSDTTPIIFSNPLPKAGESTDVSFNVVNNGLMKLDGYEATVTVGGETFGTASIDNVIKGGESDTVKISGIMPDTLSAETPIEISVKSADGESSDVYSGKVPFGSDIEFETKSLEYEEGAIKYTVDISNNGNAASGDFVIELSKIKNGEGLVGTATAENMVSLAPGETVTKEITLSPETLKPADFGSLGMAELSLKAVSGETEIGSDVMRLSSEQFAGKITINGSQAPLTVAENGKKMLNVQKTPVEADSVYTFESADSSIAYVDENGRLTGVKQGETTITVTETNSGLTQTFNVTVTEPDNTPTAPPEATKRPSNSGSGGSAGGSGFNTGGSSATAAPSETADPNATLVPDTTVTSEPSAATVFEDVPADHWAYGCIMDLYNAGIINGETETLFAPDDNITRAEFTKIAVGLFGITPEGTSSFSDVPADEWYAPYIAAAEASGIINGTSDTTFSPDDNITREQIAAILYRYASVNGVDVSIGESTNILSYTDAAAISDYAISAMQWACGAGIINGYEDGSLNPDGSATRAEAAAMISRYKK